MEFCNFLDEMVANGAILLEFSFNYVFHFLGVCEIIKILIGNYAFLIRDVILGLLLWPQIKIKPINLTIRRSSCSTYNKS